MAKSVEDLALAMNVLAGHDTRYPATPQEPVPNYARALGSDLEGVRLGVPTGYFFSRLAPEVRAKVKKAIDDFEQLGAKVQNISIPHLEEAAIAVSIILFAEAAASLEKWHLTRSRDLGDDVRARLNLGATIPAALYLKAQRIRRRIQENFSAAFRRVDALITPQLPITAPKLNQGSVSWGKKSEAVPSALTRFTRIYNLVGIPSLSIPCGFSAAGLPIGLQIAGKPFDEKAVLRVGHAYEANTPWKDRHPRLDG